MLQQTKKILEALKDFHTANTSLEDYPKRRQLNYQDRKAVQALIDKALADKSLIDSPDFVDRLDKAVGDTLYLSCLFNGDRFGSLNYKLHTVFIKHYSEKSIATLESVDKFGVAITKFELIGGNYHFSTYSNSEIEFTLEEVEVMKAYLLKHPELFFTGEVTIVEYNTFSVEDKLAKNGFTITDVEKAFWAEPFSNVEYFADKFGLSVENMQKLLDSFTQEKVELPFTD